MAEQKESQRLIGDAARGLLERAGGVERVRHRRGKTDLDQSVWRKMAENGWPGILVSEDKGGAGFDFLDTVELLEALGRYLAPEPVAATMASAAALSDLAGEDVDGLLQSIISGEHTVCLVEAHRAGETGSPMAATSGWRSDLHLADMLLVAVEGEQGRAIFAVEKRQVDLEIRATVDGGTSGRLALSEREFGDLSPLVQGPAADRAFRRGADVERLANAGILTGAALRALELSTDYMKQRTQFGVPIGSFQALQHRAATMHVEAASSAALVRESMLAFPGPRATAAAAAAKHYAGEAALHVTREAIQLHGAIGFTDEHDIGLYFRKALALVAADGGTRASLRAWMSARTPFDLIMAAEPSP